MTKYDKELQSNTDEYDDAMKPAAREHREESDRDERRDQEEEEQKD